MSEPTPPIQPTAYGSGDAAGNSPVQFKSTQSAKANQPTDYFAEQNKKRAEKKQKQKKFRRWAIPVGVILALVVIAVVVFLVINNARNSGTAISDDYDSDNDGQAALIVAQELSDKATEVYTPTYSFDENGNIVISGDLDAAEETFEAALKDSSNQKRIDSVYLSQIIFYASLSDNQRIIELAEKVNPDNLTLSEKIRFYNLVYLAYAALGDKAKAEHYSTLTSIETNKVTGIGG